MAPKPKAKAQMPVHEEATVNNPLLDMVAKLTPEQKGKLQALLSDSPADASRSEPEKLNADISIKIRGNNAATPIISNANKPVNYGLVCEVLQKLLQALQVEMTLTPYPAERVQAVFGSESRA